VNAAKPSLAVVLCGFAACSVYEGSLGNGASDGGAGSTFESSAGPVTTDGSGGSDSTAGGASGNAGAIGGEGGSTATGGGGVVDASGGAAGASSAASAGGASGTGAGGASGAAGNGTSAGGSGGAGAGGAGAGRGGASGGGAAGAGGAGGPGGSGGTSVDAGPLGICNYSNPITLLYRNWPREAGASVLDFSFKLVNGGTQAIALNTIIVRYYLANEIASPTTLVSYGDVCCPDKVITTHVAAAVRSMTPPATGADTYIEFTFDATAGTLAPAHTVEVEAEFSNATASASNPSNDYSYIATATGTQAQWDNCPSSGNCVPFRSCQITVHQAGTLVWGNPPK
jgi:hypothetical protein